MHTKIRFPGRRSTTYGKVKDMNLIKKLRFSQDVVTTILEVAGLLLVSGGVSLLDFRAGVIVLGFSAILVGYFLGRKG